MGWPKGKPRGPRAEMLARAALRKRSEPPKPTRVRTVQKGYEKAMSILGVTLPTVAPTIHGVEGNRGVIEPCPNCLYAYADGGHCPDCGWCLPLGIIHETNTVKARVWK